MNILRMIEKDPNVSGEFKKAMGFDGKNEKIASEIDVISCELESYAKGIILLNKRLEKIVEILRGENNEERGEEK